MNPPVLLVIPRNQFQEEELFPLLDGLEKAGWPSIVLSQSGQEATGMGRTKFTPDGMLIDWNRQEGVSGKYPAVLVLGGKGASKSLWTDNVLPQILTDHHRAGSVIGGIGLGVVPLARAGLLAGEASAPEDPAVIRELEQAAISPSPDSVTCTGRVITAANHTAIQAFLNRVLEALTNQAST